MRTFLKGLAFWVSTVLVSPVLLSFAIRAPLIGRDRALMGSSQLLALLPGLVGQYLRRAFYCRVLADCHPSVTIEFGTIFSKAGAELERDVYVGPMCHVGLARIERDVLIAAGVHIPSGSMTHGISDPDVPIREQPGVLEQITVGAGAWVGSGSVVMANVGEGTVVASGAVVTKALPAGVLAAGVPAKVLRERSGADLQEQPTSLPTGSRET